MADPFSHYKASIERAILNNLSPAAMGQNPSVSVPNHAVQAGQPGNALKMNYPQPPSTSWNNSQVTQSTSYTNYLPQITQASWAPFHINGIIPPTTYVGTAKTTAITTATTTATTTTAYGNASLVSWISYNGPNFSVLPPAPTATIPCSPPLVQFTSSIPSYERQYQPSVSSSYIPPDPDEIQATPPVPPNWEASHTHAIQVMAPFSRVPVSPTSCEYRVLASLIEPQLTITNLELIVNPELWRKFTNTRKDIMCSKTEDLKLLGALGLEEKEVLHRAHVSMNFDKHPSLGAVAYSDNVALLFHCTRSKVDDVLSQGLDERLGSSTGLLGRGIYFTDDPLKSLNYDANSTLLIFAVFLGDCLNVDHIADKRAFVREPVKSPEQKRNHYDLFFDSIVGRPAGVNEYVIYNRYQCCPLYTVTYQRATKAATQNQLTLARGITPPFAWLPPRKGKNNKKGTILPKKREPWPFYARTIFSQMAEDHVQLPRAPNSSKNATTTVLTRDDGENEESLAMKLSTLTELGFPDDMANLELLRKLGYSLEATIDSLLTGNIPNSATTANNISAQTNEKRGRDGDRLPSKKNKVDPGATAVNGNTSTTDLRDMINRYGVDADPLQNTDLDSYISGVGHKLDGPGTSASTTPGYGNVNAVFEVDEDCPICCVEYPSGPGHWKTLICSHKICLICYSRMEVSGVTMSGQHHTFIKCPFCQASSGVEIGSCPNGTMTVTEILSSAAGYENYTALQIAYNVRGNPGLNRIAYLPNSPEGNEVVKLLQKAWDRRLCFSIGSSITTGKQNVLVWNIHHKTALQGGEMAHGYPDPGYLTRVKQELAQFGIE